jgi:hypothetical protein
MEFGESISDIWDRSPFDPPSIPLLLYRGFIYLVVDDLSTIIRFMDDVGNVYGIPHEKAEIENLDRSEYYFVSSSPRSLGTWATVGRDQFVFNYIIPVLYPRDNIHLSSAPFGIPLNYRIPRATEEDIVQTMIDEASADYPPPERKYHRNEQLEFHYQNEEEVREGDIETEDEYLLIPGGD